MKIITTAFVLGLMSTTVIAGEVSPKTLENADSITILCSNDVRTGSIELSNPPRINCGDMSKAQFAIGTGFTFKSNISTDDLINMTKGRTRKPSSKSSFLEGARRMYETNTYPNFGGTSTLNRYNETAKRAGEFDRLKSMEKNFVFNEKGIGQFTSDFDNPNSKVSNLVRRKRGYRGSGCSANEIIRGAC
tara:strand:+ start:599 stop:1168 length:570 start_codon:yes stop_codon:yes gene_type:complete